MVPVSLARSTFALLLLLACAPVVHGQSNGHAAPVLGSRAALQAPVLIAQTAPSRIQVPTALLLETHLALAAAGDRRMRTVSYTLGGAVLGSALGLAVLFGPANCRTGESMCGLAIPLYVGAGAAGGGLVGYLLGSSLR